MSDGSGLNFCLSSRHFPNIKLRQGTLRLTLEHQHGHARDIREYIRNRLRGENGRTLDGLATAIRSKAAGVFMWVVLVIGILNKILQKGRIDDAWKRLADIPEKLGDLFHDMLMRDESGRDGLLLCIQWILYAKSPLKCSELYYALQSGLEPFSEPTSQFTGRRHELEKYMRLFILDKSKGLAEVVRVDNTVQFIHESVRDFLITDNGVDLLWPQRASGFEAMSHERLKNCCLTYLNLTNHVSLPKYTPQYAQSRSGRDAPRIKDDTKELSAWMEIDWEWPFLTYSYLHLFYHAEAAAQVEPQDTFLRSVNFAKWLYVVRGFPEMERFPTENKNRSFSKEATLAYVFAARNWHELLKTQLRVGGAAVTFMTHEVYEHPVIAAAANDRIDICRTILSDAEVNPDATDLRGRTLLSIASWRGLNELVMLLLREFDVNVNHRDRKGRTPLFNTIRWDKNRPIYEKKTKATCIAIVDCILGTPGVDIQPIATPHAQLPRRGPGGGSGDILLKATAREGWDSEDEEDSEAIANDTSSSEDDEDDLEPPSPLWEAVKRAPDEVFRRLLGIQIGSAAGLSIELFEHLVVLSKRMRRTSIFRILMFEASNNEMLAGLPSLPQHCQETLVDASESGDVALVEHILRHDNINCNVRGYFGWTALNWAAYLGFEDIVKLLLNAPGIDVNLPDEYGDTPLVTAIHHDRLSIVKLFLGAEKIDVNRKNNEGKTPLMKAVRKARVSIIELLLTVEGIDIEVTDRLGWTALGHNLGTSREEIARLFRESSGRQQR